MKAFADFTESLDKGEELDKELATKLFEGAKTRMKGFMTLLKDGLPEEDVFEALKENRTKVQGQYRAIVNATAPKINGVGPSGTNGKTQSALPNGNKNGNASSSSTPPTTTPKPVAGRKRAAEDDREGETTTKKAKKDKAHGKHAQEVIELEN